MDLATAVNKNTQIFNSVEMFVSLGTGNANVNITEKTVTANENAYYTTKHKP